MNNPTKTSMTLLAPAICASLLASGCVTPVTEIPHDGGTLTSGEIKAFYQRAKDPRSYWITVYDGDNGPEFSGDHRTHPNQVCERPFQSGKGSMVPIIEIQERAPQIFPALIDTSSAESWVDFPFAVRLGVSPLNNPAYKVSPTHVMDDAEGMLCAADKIRMGELHVETVLVFARAVREPLGPLLRGNERPQSRFVLGMRFLDAFRSVQFDFPNRRVLFASDRGLEPQAENLIASLPYSLKHGALSVEGTINGKPQSFVVDTVGNYALALPSATNTPIRHLSLGDLVFRDVLPTTLAEEQLGMPEVPRVGLNLLSKFRVTLDSADKVVHFEKPDDR